MSTPFDWTCPKCNRKVGWAKKYERERGWCCSCEVKSWAPEKTEAIRKLIGASIRGETDRLPALYKQALEHHQKKAGEKA